VRALDAIHLATALAIDDDELEFITYDDRLADAARAEGLTVVQPGR
jgi:predicted nucleic acid-binding protein